ncbi:HNH endonuclease [Actinacidiphila oryziradicis]|uniref:HNH endonuclease n=1 Tax=Actinacidiphila oryziradicis TaxID=2571141 RepID=UPI0023F161AE|nr:HNH endonuclease [Actinacidiphila oryziradicis]MCW2868715.1 hypothetical protein [Actinacidiphila oryziradicis]
MTPGELQRRTRMQNRTEMPRTAGPVRKTRINQRSAKTAKQYRMRARLVADLLTDYPWCQIRWDDNCQGLAVDVDEILSRGRGGDFLDPANCQTACRYCHGLKHDRSDEAVERGVSLHSWPGDAA